MAIRWWPDRLPNIRPGNCLPIANIPVGTLIHNIELKEGKGGQLVRAAGAAAQLLAKEGDYAQVRLPSGEVRLVRQACYATIGQVGNVDHSNSNWAKPAASATWASARRCVVQPCPRAITRMVVVKAASPLVCRVRRAPWGKPTRGYKNPPQ